MVSAIPRVARKRTSHQVSIQRTNAFGLGRARTEEIQRVDQQVRRLMGTPSAISYTIRYTFDLSDDI